MQTTELKNDNYSKRPMAKKDFGKKWQFLNKNNFLKRQLVSKDVWLKCNWSKKMCSLMTIDQKTIDQIDNWSKWQVNNVKQGKVLYRGGNETCQGQESSSLPLHLLHICHQVISWTIILALLGFRSCEKGRGKAVVVTYVKLH
jgi:hypothetical protein